MTPPSLAATLLAAGWTRLSPTDWQRPHTKDRHSWPVAELIERDQEARVPPPPKLAPKPPKPGFQMRGSNGKRRYAPKLPAERAAHRPLEKHEEAARIVKLRDVDKMTWKAIAAIVGGVQGRAMYLYKRYLGLLTDKDGS